MWASLTAFFRSKIYTFLWRIVGILSFSSLIWKMKTIRETIIKIAVWVDRPEQSITHCCFGLRGKNVLLTAKACITAGPKQMGCLQCIYLQLFKLLVGELRHVQTTQACPSAEHESGLLGGMVREMLDEWQCCWKKKMKEEIWSLEIQFKLKMRWVTCNFA